ncbi:hypothetical protein [Altericroceibacterium xinjiangense]|uniref:hypothetical protein n=1 Tax=Altericroceibacterium xinjiangense TaxID=762261 RepID=UPI000F7E8EFE|nr:hypothetical protein [Altericroceibacterium xinjiangense]
MASITSLHLQHTRELFFAERSRREAIRGSLSTPVAAISFSVFALSTLSVEIDLARWQHFSSAVIMLLAVGAVAALLASAYQVVMSEWLFVYHEPPRLPDLLDGDAAHTADEEEARVRGILASSYAVAYEQYLKGNAISARRRTWALRLILLALLLEAAAFVILPFHRAGF